jgi:MoaA/NifB/PqqE/SkfB family radical SAM enzyme
MTSDTESVKYHYGEIEKYAQQLEEGISVHNIDTLIPISEKVFEHHKAAKSRLEVIAKAIQKNDT